MNEYFPKPRPVVGNVKVEFELPSYAAKADLENATDAYTLKCSKKVVLPNLKSEAFVK